MHTLSSRRLLAVLVVTAGCGLALLASPEPEGGGKPDLNRKFAPKIAPASNEGELSCKRIRVPEGTTAELFAAEPLLANPVCFAIDEKNRFYVAETFRIDHGITDVRDKSEWLEDDLVSRTVADRDALYKKHLGKDYPSFAVAHDRVRLLEDTTGAGKADKATVFADGFNQAVTGIGAGLLARGGKVWYTCIPDLWLLEDTKGTGTADVKTSLQTGYGVHIGLYGHDLHGLRMGPDGKLYFSIGDRGLHVVTKTGKTVSVPDTGAVLRCNPDGSDLELFATGLRNPQELVFDRFGNLWTGDNNADHGDRARLVYVVEGGDTGWRIGYQHLHLPTELGPWNSEKIWQTAWDGQAASSLPPVAYIASGPSGITHDPGVSQLPERYRDHFFLCDFRGSSGNSGIRAFGVKPKGATFEMVDEHEMIWSVLATDVDFGTDGALYISDWVDGWGLTGKGRIIKVRDPKKANDPAVVEVKKLLADGFTARPAAELALLLAHADQRVRQEAQFALAARGGDSIGTLTAVAETGKSQLARLHALWGLGQIGRIEPKALDGVVARLSDTDAEVKAQALKVLGDARLTAVQPRLVELLRDAEPRVRFFAAQALSKIEADATTIPALVQAVRENADKDPYLRHALVMGLTASKDLPALTAVGQDNSVSVRLAALLALRRLGNPAVAKFLSDADPRLVLEAARAINDEPINESLPALAALISQRGLENPLLYRVLNANFRLGKPENAKAIASFAARADAPTELRLEALRMLDQWATPSGRDRILGIWRPLTPRPGAVATEALRPALGGIFSGPDELRSEAAKLASKLGITEIGPALRALVNDSTRPVQVRVDTLRALATLKDKELDAAVTIALADRDARLRIEGWRVKAGQKPDEVVPQLAKLLDSGERPERQGAFAILASLPGPAVDAVFSRWLDRALAKDVPPDMLLDLLDGAGKRTDSAVKASLKRYDGQRSATDHLSKYREALVGGDADEGRRIFLTKAAVSCVRCHKVTGEGGDVGPDLSKVGGQHPREYLLESIVEPNKQIAKGFETIVLILNNDQIVAGILKSEDANEVRLLTAEGKLIAVARNQIAERQTGKSSMPEDLVKQLSKYELRDLVEFLAGLK